LNGILGFGRTCSKPLLFLSALLYHIGKGISTLGEKTEKFLLLIFMILYQKIFQKPLDTTGDTMYNIIREVGEG